MKQSLRERIEAVRKETEEHPCCDPFSCDLFARLVEMLELMLALADQIAQPQLAFIGDCEDCDGHGWNYDDDGSGDTHTCTTCKGQEAGPTELGRSILELLEWREKNKDSQ